ncbi:MAG: helix-turn-helix domain-containing protein [Patescibacteria group bacterium]|jgi:sugar-specific transcriptional regulator TrmB
MDLTILKKLDLSDKEIKIYLKLLEQGALSVRVLSELTGLNRGTAYDILKQLQELGLVSYYHQDTKQKFVAEDPEKLLKLLNNKEDRLHEAKKKIKEIIPELKSLKEKEGDRPVTKFYEGKEGVKSILEDVLETMGEAKEKEYYVYSSTKASEAINKAFPEYTRERIKRKIFVKAISLAQGGNMHGLDERRWLKTSEDAATFIIIYAGKCAYISRDMNGNPVGVIIENRMVYETQRILFFELWERMNIN